MSKILVAFEVKNNTTDNNISSLMTVLSEMNTEVQVVRSSKIKASHIIWCDVLILNRPNSVYSLEVIKKAKQAGKYCILSLDDDIINLPNAHPDYWKRKYTLKCFALGDALMSPNPLILNDYCEKNGLKRVNTNSFVEQKDIKPLHSIGSKIRFVYAAGKDHASLFNKFILPFFDNIVSEFRKRVDFTFIGVEPKVSESEDVHFVKAMPYKDYLEYMARNEFDVGLAPLENNSFCARKYFAKYFEYGRYGILGLYSNVKPYTYAVKNGYNGLLVDDNVEAWKDAIFNVIEQPDKIIHMAIKAQDDLMEKYSLDTIVNNMRNQCPELEFFKGQEEDVDFEVSLLSKGLYELKSNYKKAVYHGKKDGFKGLYNRIVNKLI